MKKAILIGVTALTILSSHAFMESKIANAALTDEIMNTNETSNDKVKDMVEKAAPRLIDITGHWAESSIIQAVNKGYVMGYPNEKFLPNNNVSRAEFIKMAVSALDIKVESQSGSWYTSYVQAAKVAGIYDAEDFSDSNLTRPLSREELSKIAVRALGIKGVQEKQWMYLATKNGIISGTAPGVISPEGTTTRAQAIAVIERILRVKDGKALTTDKYAIAAAELYWHKTNMFTVAEEIFDGPLNHSNPRLGISSWKESKLLISSADGSIQARVNSLIAVDWNDPKDPNRKLLPTTDKLYWLYAGQERKFTDDLECYILILDSEYTVNKKPKGYPINRLSLYIQGYDGPDHKDKLTQAAPILSKDPKKEIYGMAVPKKFIHYGSLSVSVETMTAGARVYKNSISTSRVEHSRN